MIAPSMISTMSEPMTWLALYCFILIGCASGFAMLASPACRVQRASRRFMEVFCLGPVGVRADLNVFHEDKGWIVNDPTLIGAVK